ncbi:hypothetical protein [Nocardiopsis potens]|uniref:hypothetical protein n=1 Tax=Nocardiopsis potens TaxID=1246458 RepID=UPI0005946602|nr:hypothetical protein [Nocardiopsis potens]
MPSLTSACAVVSPEGETAPGVDELTDFYRDLAAPFGTAVDAERVRAGTRVSHRDLADRLASVRPPGPAPGLIVLTHALPDLHPFTAVAPRLDALLGGGATAFGISQQGLSGPFTALRLVDRFQRSGRCTAAAVAVLEQSTMPSPHPHAPAEGLVDSGVLLEFGTGGGPVLSAVEEFAPSERPGPRAAALAAGSPEGTLLVLGPGVDGDEVDDGGGAADRVRARADTHCTGIWLALAENLRTWAEEYRTVLLCDRDPGSGRGHLAVFRSSPGD